MYKYLAKPTRIIGPNGVVKTIDQVSCNGDHSGGTSSGTSNCECDSKRYKINCYGSNGQTITYYGPQSNSNRTLENVINQINLEDQIDYISTKEKIGALKVKSIEYLKKGIGNV